MARTVDWTSSAWDDLAEIADHISRDSPFYAASFVQRARDAAASLSDFAERGTIVPELADAKTRELLIGAYRLIYRLSEDQVIVLALVHGARRAHRK